ncbi:4Fe-4S binding protein [Herbidospora mongoliensis]|uniref:4Fe-4S binding protein n=1 Tax=Herbidospora mongoliensis TaxID=688067 RepID=UPI0009FC5656|nr:4Fe-4S binding protein [Herbidospora mongoliensis]
MLSRSVTQQYPEVRPDLPPRSRGVIALVEENCTSCMLCARECPDWCIYIDSHKETLPAPEGGRPRQRNVLDRFAIDFSLCMYCGICIEVCPFDALFWAPEFEYAEGDIRNLLHEKDRLGEWAASVPVPPRHEDNAEPPKELTASRKPPRGPGGPGTPKPETPAESSDAPKAQPSPPEAEGSGETKARAPRDATTTPAETKARPPRDVRSIRPPGRLPESRTSAERSSSDADEPGRPGKPGGSSDSAESGEPGGGERSDEEGP